MISSEGSKNARCRIPYRYLEDIATADVAFEAWGDTMEETFISSADATMNVMVSDLGSIEKNRHKDILVSDEAVDMLLFAFLQELIFFKDAERLLLRVESISIEERGGLFILAAKAFGDEIDLSRHDLVVDVKAVTLHRFIVARTGGKWRARVVLDI